MHVYTLITSVMNIVPYFKLLFVTLLYYAPL